MHFTIKLKEVYQSKGNITLQEFANMMQLPRSTIQSNMIGIIPSEKTLKQMIGKLNINPEFFYVENVPMYLKKPKELTKKTFSEKLQDIRNKIDMNYSSLSNNLDYSLNKVGCYFSGRTLPTFEFMRRMIVFYNINPNFFFFDDEKIIKDDMYLYPKRFLDDEAWFARKWYEEIQILTFGTYKVTPQEIKETSDKKIITIANFLKDELESELIEKR